MLEKLCIFLHLKEFLNLVKEYIFDLMILKNQEIENEFMFFLLQNELLLDMKLEH